VNFLDFIFKRRRVPAIRRLIAGRVFQPSLTLIPSPKVFGLGTSGFHTLPLTQKKGCLIRNFYVIFGLDPKI
jgi:hypothetical protein